MSQKGEHKIWQWLVFTPDGAYQGHLDGMQEAHETNDDAMKIVGDYAERYIKRMFSSSKIIATVVTDGALYVRGAFKDITVLEMKETFQRETDA